MVWREGGGDGVGAHTACQTINTFAGFLPRSSLLGLNSVVFDLSRFLGGFSFTHCLSAYMLMGWGGILQVSGRDNEPCCNFIFLFILFGGVSISCVTPEQSQVPFCCFKRRSAVFRSPSSEEREREREIWKWKTGTERKMQAWCQLHTAAVLHYWGFT